MPFSLTSSKSTAVQASKRHFWRILLAIFMVALITALIELLNLDEGFANVSLLYLLLVFLLSMYAGRTAAILSALISFFAFLWFFVEPRHTLSVKSPNEWLTLGMFLLVSVLTGHLTARLKASEQEAKRMQLETETLASASWAVSSQLTTEEALTEVLKQIAKVADFQLAAIASRDKEGKLILRAGLGAIPKPEQLLADMELALTGITSTGAAKPSPDGESSLYLPLNRHKQPNSSGEGAIYLRLKEGARQDSDDRRLVETLLNHASVILHREELTREQSRVEALAQADVLKTALLAMVTHDFRSPITGIKAAVSVLQEESSSMRPVENTEMKSLLQGIELEVDRLNRMVGNILDMSKLEADAWKPILESSDLKEILGSTLSGFSESDNQRVVLKIVEPLQEILVDPVQIEQVLKNLVENALKYSPPETSVLVEVSQSDNYTTVEVKDKGRGILAADKPLIFDRFYRARGLSESTIAGVGVGLTICKALVEAHKGQITALDNPGGGTIMRVTLPMQDQKEGR